jgi:hypothetical protein
MKKNKRVKANLTSFIYYIVYEKTAYDMKKNAAKFCAAFTTVNPNLLVSCLLFMYESLTHNLIAC